MSGTRTRSRPQLRSAPESTRQIRDAARQLLFTRGPRGLTMDAVARVAHVSKTTLYAHYPSRHALLVAVVADEAAQFDPALGTPPDTLEDLATDLERFVLSLHEFLTDNRHARLIQAMGQAAPPVRDLAAVYRHGPQRSHERLAGYLRQAQQRGLVDCGDADHSAELLLGMTMGMDLVRAMYQRPSPHRGTRARAAHARRVVEAFMALIDPARIFRSTAPA